jgi:phage N-6-adenine-methyltransferase
VRLWNRVATGPRRVLGQALFDALNMEFGFTVDVCASPENSKCPRFFSVEQDGLKQDWAGEIVFMNPPYGKQIGKWVRKAFYSAQNGSTCVCLVPARTDTRWFHKYCMKGEIRFLRGRLRHNDTEGRAPFPSMIVIFRPQEFKLSSFYVE